MKKNLLIILLVTLVVITIIAILFLNSLPPAQPNQSNAEQLQAKLQELRALYEQKEAESCDVSGVQALYQQGLAAYNSGDYAEVNQLAEEAEGILTSLNCPPSAIVEHPATGGDILMGINLQQFMDDIVAAKSLGVDVVATTLRWSSVEPTDDNFTFDSLDEIVNEAESSGIALSFNVRAMSEWGTVSLPVLKGSYRSSSMPKDLAEWREFLTTVASRYKGRDVDISYEIENEVNAEAFWNGSIDDYVSLLEESYATIKSADPNAKVVASALACGITKNVEGGSDAAITSFNSHLGKILDSGAFDVVSVHDYYFPDREVNGVTFQNYLDNILGQMVVRGLDKEVWITETGYVSKPTKVGSRTDPGSLENQADWLEQAYAYADSVGVDRIFWLLLKDRDEPYFGSMGLLNDDGTRRPVADVFSGFTF